MSQNKWIVEACVIDHMGLVRLYLVRDEHNKLREMPYEGLLKCASKLSNVDIDMMTRLVTPKDGCRVSYITQNNYVASYCCKSDGMRREVYTMLDKWRMCAKNFVCYVKGARQVGKTYAVKQYCYFTFENTVYIDLLRDEDSVQYLQYILNKNLNPEELAVKIRSRWGFFDNTSDSVIIVDEVRYKAKIYESLSGLFVGDFKTILISSSMEAVDLRAKRGKVLELPNGAWSITMLPMSLSEVKEAMPDKTLKEVYTQYIKYGGYPKIVQRYRNDGYIPPDMYEEILDFFYCECANKLPLVVSREIKGLLPDVCKRLIFTSKALIFPDRPINVVAEFERYKETRVGTSELLLLILTWLEESGLVRGCYSSDDTSHYTYFAIDCGLADYLQDISKCNKNYKKWHTTRAFVQAELMNGGYVARGFTIGEPYDFIACFSEPPQALGVSIQVDNLTPVSVLISSLNRREGDIQTAEILEQRQAPLHEFVRLLEQRSNMESITIEEDEDIEETNEVGKNSEIDIEEINEVKENENDEEDVDYDDYDGIWDEDDGDAEE